MQREIISCYYDAHENKIMGKLFENPSIADSGADFERKLENLQKEFNISYETLDSVLSAKNLFEAKILSEMYILGFQDGERLSK